MTEEVQFSAPQTQDDEQLALYRSRYSGKNYDKSNKPEHDYFTKLYRTKLAILKQYYTGGPVLDLCCGSGEFLIHVANYADTVTGLDFSPEILEEARVKVDAGGYQNVDLVEGNARSLPFEPNRFAMIFSYSSLYTIPGVDEVIAGCAKALAPGGVAILDLGVSHSLNQVVTASHRNIAKPYYEPWNKLQKAIEQNGMSIEAVRGFQLLPLWGHKPKWLRPLLHPVWKTVMATPVGDTMLDEVLCSVWPFAHFAFRRIVVCRKPLRGSDIG